MILYLDTSALLKLYLAEPESDCVRGAVRDVEVCTHQVAWVEVHAGLAMAVRMGRLSDPDMDDHLRSFETDWDVMDVVGLDDALTRRAGGMARQFGLRAYDSVHLAAAERVMITVGSGDFMFMGFDARLDSAARALGMTLPDAGKKSPR
ncbi:MAG TPA: type II toxin-antitoxin system VapC family toxin [Rhodanobacteraceae bacterium]|nr:type II toxin-antitoxin system VapC family toxin [Rhodanobacteraceae bacterium]